MLEPWEGWIVTLRNIHNGFRDGTWYIHSTRSGCRYRYLHPFQERKRGGAVACYLFSRALESQPFLQFSCNLFPFSSVSLCSSANIAEAMISENIAIDSSESMTQDIASEDDEFIQ